MEPYKICSTCRDPSRKTNLCSNCRSNYYCSRECQRKDWSRHKGNCVSYEKVKKIYEPIFKGFKSKYPFNPRYFLDWILKNNGRINIWYTNGSKNAFNDIIMRYYNTDPSHKELWKKIVENNIWMLHKRSKISLELLLSKTSIKEEILNDFQNQLKNLKFLFKDLEIRTLKKVEMDEDSIDFINDLCKTVKITHIDFCYEKERNLELIHKESLKNIGKIEKHESKKVNFF